ncbi:hypothetical protein [Acinetobacter proteolyticus]|uniref:hypothetical protein n=1 Tax=Acinetobacter proteolyticus TaxID=1776741 RepID=UPI003D9886E1
MSFTPEQWLKIILGTLSLIGIIVAAIFAVNKRSHKIGNVTGNNNNITNGDSHGKK